MDQRRAALTVDAPPQEASTRPRPKAGPVDLFPWWAPLALAVVPIVFLLVFYAWPVAAIIGRGLSFGAIGDVLTDPGLRSVAWFTLWQAVVSTAVTVAVALPGAYVMARFRFTGQQVVLAIVTVPFVLPTVVVGAAFLALLPDRFHDSVWAIVIAHVFFNYAVVVRTVSTLWSHLDPRLEEAARVLGASRWRAFREVTWPLLRPSIMAAASIVFLFTFTSFGTVLILGGPRHPTLEVEIYRQTAQALEPVHRRRPRRHPARRDDGAPVVVDPRPGAPRHGAAAAAVDGHPGAPAHARAAGRSWAPTSCSWRCWWACPSAGSWSARSPRRPATP